MTFVRDTFTDVAGTALTAHVGEVGAVWAEHPATVGLPPEIGATNELQRGAHSDVTLCYASGVPPTADYDVTAQFRCPGLPSGFAGIFARLDSATANGYLLQFEASFGPQRWALYSLSAGSYNYLGGANGGPGVGTLRVAGDAISVIVDGVEIFTTTNADHAAAGQVGVRFDPSGGADAIWLDNLTAGDPVLVIAPVGIAPEGASGRPSLRNLLSVIYPVGIAPGVCGRPGLRDRTNVIRPVGWTEGAVGTPTLELAGVATIRPTGIPATGHVGTPTLVQPSAPGGDTPPGGPVVTTSGRIIPRNILVDRKTGERYPWPVNHTSEDSIKTLGRRLTRGGVTASGRLLSRRLAFLIRQPEVTGPMHLLLQGSMIDPDRTQYQTFVQFFNDCDDRTFDYIDVVGDSYHVVIVSFDARRKMSVGKLSASYFTYTLEVEVLAVNAGAYKGYVV